MLRFSCPSCRTVLQLSTPPASGTVACPRCGQRLQVPSAPPERPVGGEAPASRAGVGWHYARGDQRLGPISERQLREMLASAELPPNTLVWSSEVNDWVPANSLPVFSAACRTADAAGPPPLPTREAVPIAPPVTSAPAPARAPLWKRALAEVWATATTTARHAARPVAYARARRQERTLCRREEDARLTLGKRLYKSEAGDPAVLDQIDAIKTRGGAPGQRAAARLEEERRRLLLRLAEPALVTGEGPKGTEDDRAAILAARERLDAHRSKVAELRSGLWPRGGAGWRRVALGGGTVVAVVALVIFLATRPRSPEEPPAPEVAAAPDAPPPELTTQQVVERCEKSVALIKGDTGSGSGFLIRKGVLATNAHVLANSPIERINIYFPSVVPPDKKPRPAKALLYEDRARDLAFVSVETDLPPLSVAPGYQLIRGQSVVVIGNPGVTRDVTLQNAVSQGIMSTLIHAPDDFDYYQLNIAVNPGNSGGPVLDNRGQVLGVVTIKAQQEGVAFCVPCGEVEKAAAAAAASTPKQCDDTRSRHDAQAVCRRLDRAGDLYLDALDLSSLRARNAIEAGDPAEDVMRRTNDSLRAFRKKNDESLADDLRPTVGRLTSEPSLADDVREKMSALWDLHGEIKKDLDSFRGTLAAFDERTRKWRGLHRYLANTLRARLGISEDF
jgi:hypothetical protein